MKMKKRFLSVLLGLVMVLVLMPGMSLTAYAYDENPYASLVNQITDVTFDGKTWYIIEDNSTAVNAGTVTLLAKECVGSSQYNASGSFVAYESNPTVKTAVDNWYDGNITAAAKTAVSGGAMFLLTREQAKAITNAEVRKCSNVTNGGWWLCSPSDDGPGAAYVYGGSGDVDDYGCIVGMPLGVRPALKLNLSSVIFSSESNTFSLNPAPTYTGFGGLITNDTEVTISEVSGKTWYVIANDSSTVTLLSKESFENKAFNSSGTGNDYATSEIKTYVDGLTGEGQPLAGISSVISDLTLIDITTAQGLTETKRKGAGTGWWLRSPGGDDRSAACVDGGSGVVYASGSDVTDTRGVRPALKLDLSKVTFDSTTNTFSVLKKYPLWVGGTQVTSGNAGDIFNDGKASYNAETATLTLNGFVYSGDGVKAGAIYADGNLKVMVTGQNSVTSTKSGVHGIYAGGTLSVTGSNAESTLNITTTSNGYAVQVNGSSAVFTGLNMALSGNRGIVVNANNVSDDISIVSCTISFASGMDRALQTWNGEGGASLTIRNSELSGYGRQIVRAESPTGDAVCTIEDSTIDLGDLWLESNHGDGTLTIDHSNVTLKGSSSVNGSINLGTRDKTDGKGKATLIIKNDSDVNCSGSQIGINAWTWGEENDCGTEVLVSDSNVTASGTYYGLAAYALYKGDTLVSFTDSTASLEGYYSGVEICSDASYNGTGDKKYIQENSDVTVNANYYGIDVDNSTNTVTNSEAITSITIEGGSITAKGGLYTGSDGETSITMSNTDIIVDMTGLEWYTIATDNLEIKSGSYSFIDNEQYGILVSNANITGGKYSSMPDEDMVAEGYTVVENTGADKEIYPYIVQKLPTVAKIGDNEYTSLKNAVAAAQSGDTITLVADDRISFAATGQRILIDKTLTITGAVDENGKPKYTVYGHPTDLTQGMNMIFVKPTASAITFTVSNVAFSEFGNENATTNVQGAIIYVSEGSVNGTSVALNNLEFDKFNRDAIRIYKHTLTVDGCTIDCAKTGDHLTKGIALNNGANATIENTIIKNSGCTYANWDSAAIESIGGCTAVINNCTVVDSENGIIIQGNDAQGTVTIKNTNISVSDCAVSSSGENIAVAIESGEYTGKIDVRGLDSDPGSKLTITDGNFIGDFRADLVNDVEILGGIFDLSDNTYCGFDTLASYCKAGYYPFAVENETDVYEVLPSVTVTFNANDGAETEPVTQYMQKNVATALAENSFTAPVGKQFDSWNTLASPTAENPGTAYADKAEVTLTGDLTLYAQWILPPATVVTAPKAKTLTFDGQTHALVEAGEATGGTMYYAVTTTNTAPTDENLYTTSIPTATDAGTYYVWYKVVGDANHSDTEPASVIATIALVEPTITGANLVLDGTLNFRFYVALPVNFDSNGAHMVFTIHGRTIDVPFTEAETSTEDATLGQKIFSCPVYSIEMAETVKAEFRYGAGKTVTKEWSIKEYLDELTAQSGNTDKLTNLIAATKDYGHYIQPYLARLHNFIIGTGGYAEMPAANSSISTVSADTLSEYQTNWISHDNTVLDSVSYYDTFAESTTLHVLVKLKSAKNNVTATVDGAESAVTSLGSNLYGIEISGIAANNLGKTYNVTFSAGGAEFCNIDVSALTYVRAVLASRNERDEAAALTAFYNYFKAADAYGKN